MVQYVGPGLGVDPKDTFDLQKRTVPFGKVLVRTLLAAFVTSHDCYYGRGHGTGVCHQEPLQHKEEGHD